MTDQTHRGVLIYDGDCPFCSAASTALRQLDGVGAIEHDHEAAQAFLNAQFDDTPFALFFVDVVDERIWAGKTAARELCERAGMPVLIQDIVDDNYESIADAIRTVTGVARDPEPYHGTHPVTPEAAEAYVELEASARQTHRPDASRRGQFGETNEGDGRGVSRLDEQDRKSAGGERSTGAVPETSRRRSDRERR